jgi:Heterokaryon incompatibility protein (HET)
MASQACNHKDKRHFDGMELCLSCGEIIDTEPPELEPEATNYQFGWYQYWPLRADRGREIRLIDLLPSAFGNELFCEIKHYDLVDDPEYEAISYTWADECGNAGLTQHITLLPYHNKIAITTSCANALRRVRQPFHKRTLWVDSICINQSDIRERNHQVSFMCTIYSKAMRVLIDLGAGDPVSDMILDHASTGQPLVLHQNTFSSSNKSIFETKPLNPTYLDAQRFFRRRWFARLWVLQEVGVSRHALAFCGSKIVDWNWVVNIPQLLVFRHGNRNIRGSFNKCAPPALRLGTTVQNVASQGILGLLQQTQICQASDPHDRVFAILGLVGEDLRKRLRADYSKPPEWAFTQVAAWVVESYEDLRILNYKHPDDLSSNLPSWVPDWNWRALQNAKAPLAEPQLASVVRRAPPRSRMVEILVTGENFTLKSPELLDYPLNCGVRILAAKLGHIYPNPTWDDLETGLRLTSFSASLCDPREEKRSSHCAHGRRSSTNKFDEKGTAEQAQDFEPIDTLDTASARDEWDKVFSFWPSWGITNKVELQSPRRPQIHSPNEIRGTALGVPRAFGGIQECECHITADWKLPNLSPWKCPACFQESMKGHPTYSAGYRSSDWDDVRTDKFLGSIGLGTLPTLFATEYSLGYGPKQLERGDTFWILPGVDRPFALRNVDSHYVVVGPVIVHNSVVDFDICANCGRQHRREELQWEKIEIW